MSAAVYRMLLRLFPPELRRWEEEMADVFERQLADADGWTEVFAVWREALVEIVWIALPRQAIPAISLASTAVIFFGLTWALENSVAMLSAYHHLVVKFGM